MLKTKIKTKLALLVTVLAVAGVGAFAVLQMDKPAKTDIKQRNAGASFASGRVVEGKNAGDTKALKTDSKTVFESDQIATNQPKTNTVGVNWDQEGGGISALEVRVNDGKKWTDWAEIGDEDDRKDGTDPRSHNALALTSNAQQVQYRFTVTAENGSSPVITRPHLTFIDSTQGPDPTKPSLASRLLGKKALAKPSGPRVYSRGEWGCPEATSSPAWTPEYQPLYRAVVHHTVTVGNPSSSAAEVRGIWQYHTFSNGWGDIGYNYLVDKNGNIFQGRYFDQAYADTNRVDVVAGHAYGNNYGTTGIAALGDFSTQGVTSPLLNSIGNMAAFKLMRFSVNPSGYTTRPSDGAVGSALVGHRDVGQTGCPGQNLYNALNQVRSIGSSYFDPYFKQFQYDYTFKGEGVNGANTNIANLRPGQSATFYVDLQNTGVNAWDNGANRPVRLGTENPQGRASGFADGTWLSSNRAAQITKKLVTSGGTTTVQSASSIAPGEISRFEFTMTAPNVNGTFNEYFQPLAEAYTWFPFNAGLYFTINVTGDRYAYQWLDQSYNVPQTPAATSTLNLTVKNAGNVAWSNTGANPVRLAPNRPNDRTSALYHSSWISPARVATFAGKAQLDGSGNVVKDGSGNVVYAPASTINPGEAAYFSFTVQTPNRPANAQEFFSLVDEGVTWMNDLGIWWPLNVPQGYAAQWVGQSAYPTISKAAGGIGSFYIDFKNTGSFIWQKNGVVRLAPDSPHDRISGFFATGLSSGQLPPNGANWLSQNRISTFAGKVTSGILDTNATTVAPGETARFIETVDARNVPNSVQQEYVALVADGFSWLTGFGTYENVTIAP